MNGARAGTVESSLQTGLLQDPSRANVAPALAALGVRWAIVHGDAYAGASRRAAGSGWFRLVARSTPTASTACGEAGRGLAAPSSGFGAAEPAASGAAPSGCWARAGR